MIIKDLIELCPVEEIVSEIMLMYGVDESEREDDRTEAQKDQECLESAKRC